MSFRTSDNATLFGSEDPCLPRSLISTLRATPKRSTMRLGLAFAVATRSLAVQLRVVSDWMAEYVEVLGNGLCNKFPSIPWTGVLLSRHTRSNAQYKCSGLHHCEVGPSRSLTHSKRNDLALDCGELRGEECVLFHQSSSTFPCSICWGGDTSNFSSCTSTSNCH